MSQHYQDFLKAVFPQDWPPTKEFVEEYVIPHLTKQVQEACGGWCDEVHSREIQALLDYAAGRCIQMVDDPNVTENPKENVR